MRTSQKLVGANFDWASLELLAKCDTTVGPTSHLRWLACWAADTQNEAQQDINGPGLPSVCTGMAHVRPWNHFPSLAQGRQSPLVVWGSVNKACLHNVATNLWLSSWFVRLLQKAVLRLVSQYKSFHFALCSRGVDDTTRWTPDIGACLPYATSAATPYIHTVKAQLSGQAICCVTLTPCHPWHPPPTNTCQHPGPLLPALTRRLGQLHRHNTQPKPTLTVVGCRCWQHSCSTLKDEACSQSA